MADYINTSQYWGGSYWGDSYWGILTTAFGFFETINLNVIMNQTLGLSPIMNRELDFTYHELED